MRMKRLLGLLAIGGAVAYAQKRRGGELSVNGFKRSLQDLGKSLGLEKYLGAFGSRESSLEITEEDLPGSSSSGGMGSATRPVTGQSGYGGGLPGSNGSRGNRNR